MSDKQPYVTIRSSRPADGSSMSSGDSTVRGDRNRAKSRDGSGLLTSVQYGSSAGDDKTPSAATHDTSRVNYHVKHLSDFAKTLEDSAARAFPNRGRSQRYKKVQALLLHWKCDDLFVLPELEDLEQCLREDYSFETDTFSIPSDNPHLELMMRIGQMIKEHESSETLFVIYYGGHARIDESRQSTWCATRSSDSPWLQWSAIQTLLERSLSDVLILLDCCAGAASATFPNGNSITETISASSWDAIAPDPGRYSFTNALIEVLQEWKNRTYSAAMLHAELLARLKHPRPIMLNGKHFEARSTPVHFMMTSNHRAPSIEMARIVTDEQRPPSPPTEPESELEPLAATGRSGVPHEVVGSEPSEDVPHVMISLALEDDQRLDVNAWENWLAAFPAIAKYVKVQGVFKSHSTLLLLSLPVMVWDLLPEDLACNFVAFVRSNNLAFQRDGDGPTGNVEVLASSGAETGSIKSISSGSETLMSRFSYRPLPALPTASTREEPPPVDRWVDVGPLHRQHTAPASSMPWSLSDEPIPRQMILNQVRSSRTTVLSSAENIPARPDLAPHVQTRLEVYFQEDSNPNVAVKEFLASNLGIETEDIDLWFLHRREQQDIANKLQSLTIDDQRREPPSEGPRMILPGHLNKLLEILSPRQILLVDLRAPFDFEKSHIHNSINFRAPACFVQRASLEMIEKALGDESSRSIFNQWHTTKCVVFYDRHVEFTWECPTAEALFQKFRRKGWDGQGFILKGHYREFSDSFDKYIGGQRIRENAKKYLESLQEKHPQKRKDKRREYYDWLKLLEDEDRGVSSELPTADKAKRVETTVSHQKDLEDEFERRFPSLYRKALDLQPDDMSDMKAGLVEPLSRGLAKMQQAGSAEVVSKSGYPDLPGKLQDPHLADEDDLSDSDGEYQKTTAKASEDSGGSGGDPPKKGRSRNLLKMVWSGR